MSLCLFPGPNQCSCRLLAHFQHPKERSERHEARRESPPPPTNNDCQWPTELGQLARLICFPMILALTSSSRQQINRSVGSLARSLAVACSWLPVLLLLAQRRPYSPLPLSELLPLLQFELIATSRDFLPPASLNLDDAAGIHMPIELHSDSSQPPLLLRPHR